MAGILAQTRLLCYVQLNGALLRAGFDSSECIAPTATLSTTTFTTSFGGATIATTDSKCRSRLLGELWQQRWAMSELLRSRRLVLPAGLPA